MFIVLAIGSSASIVSFGIPLTIGIAQPNSVPADQPRRTRARFAEVSGEREHVAVGALEQVAVVELAGVPVDEHEDLARRPAELGDLLQRLGMHAGLLVHLVGGVLGDPLLQQVEDRRDPDLVSVLQPHRLRPVEGVVTRHP